MHTIHQLNMMMMSTCGIRYNYNHTLIDSCPFGWRCGRWEWNYWLTVWHDNNMNWSKKKTNKLNNRQQLFILIIDFRSVLSFSVLKCLCFHSKLLAFRCRTVHSVHVIRYFLIYSENKERRLNREYTILNVSRWMTSITCILIVHCCAKKCTNIKQNWRIHEQWTYVHRQRWIWKLPKRFIHWF